MRLSGREFGRLSYRTMGALIDRVNVGRRLDDIRFGQVCATIGNAAGGKKNGAFQPADFFPSLRGPDSGRQTPAQMREVLRDFVAMQKA